jgi:dCMP deaminase
LNISSDKQSYTEQGLVDTIRNKEKWDLRFLELARHFSTWSKDESTKVGCVIVNSNKTVVSSGYNGLPRGCRDDVAVRLSRPEKYFWFEHAERNAIYNAAYEGISVRDCTAYTTLCPCMDCARAIVQAGIQRVVTPEPDKVKYSKLWEEHFPKTLELFKECGIECEFI